MVEILSEFQLNFLLETDMMIIEVRKMPDYKEMYLHLARETEKAVRILIKAQQECEELYISAPEENVVMLDAPTPQRTAAAPPTIQ